MWPKERLYREKKLQTRKLQDPGSGARVCLLSRAGSAVEFEFRIAFRYAERCPKVGKEV